MLSQTDFFANDQYNVNSSDSLFEREEVQTAIKENTIRFHECWKRYLSERLEALNLSIMESERREAERGSDARGSEAIDHANLVIALT